MELQATPYPQRLVWGNKDESPSPVVSVVMPIYKKYEYLEQAIRSAVEQDFSLPYEIVISDNNTTENNPALDIVKKINSSKIMYFQNVENVGMALNGVQSILLARAKRVVFLHDDDLLCHNSLTVLYACSLKLGKAVFAKQALIDANSNLITNPERHAKMFSHETKVSKLSRIDFFLEALTTGVGSMLLRDEFIGTGGYDASFYPSHDYKLNADYITKFGGYYLYETTSMVRVANNESSQVFEVYPQRSLQVRSSIIESYKNSMTRAFLRWLSGILYEQDKVNTQVSWGHKKKEELAYSKWKYRLATLVRKSRRVWRKL